MKPQFNHNFNSSIYVWLNHLLEEKGQAYIRFSENFYRLPTNKYSQYTSYIATQSQFSYDASITGATIPSGVYVNGTFWPNNTSGMKIDYLHGQVLFSGNQNGVVSGNYTAHEVNVYPTTEKEEKLFFEKKYFKNPKNLPNWTGRLPADKVVPCIFVKGRGGDNETLCFEGMSETEVTSRLVVIADTQFIFDGIMSLLRDAKESYTPLLSADQLPFDNFGNTRSNWNYNYYATGAAASNLLYLKNVKIAEFTEDVNSFIGESCVGGIVDCDWSSLRFPKNQ